MEVTVNVARMVKLAANLVLKNGAANKEQHVVNLMEFVKIRRNVKMERRNVIMMHKKLVAVMELMGALAANILKYAVKQDQINGAANLEQLVDQLMESVRQSTCAKTK